jgi:predicted nucleotide-binding protein
MAFRPLKSFVPTADELLATDLPRLGEVLLVHLRSFEGESGNSVYQNGLISQSNFIGLQEARGCGPLRTEPEYGTKQPEVNRALMEAWSWLVQEGILMRDAGQPAAWFSITRKGDELLSRVARFEHWERLGLDQVKADLEHTGGLRVVGPQLAQMAWDWVRMKEAEGAGPRLEAAPLAAHLLLDEANKLLGEVPKGTHDNNVGAWWGRAKNVIERWDPSKSTEGKSAAELLFSNLESIGMGASERRRGQNLMVALLNHAKCDLEFRATSMKTPNAPIRSIVSRKVFVVHGHDEAAREKIARFLEQLGFEPIILHEQASRGRTVIEKVEAHSDVGFAVVLLTPDDEGCEKGGTPRPRARQNVVLELGYFLGHLGRTHVCALKRGEVEIPSDFEGVVYVNFDNSDGWKQALGKELQTANFTIDWNKAMGSVHDG